MAPPDRTTSGRFPAIPGPQQPADPFGRPTTDPGQVAGPPMPPPVYQAPTSNPPPPPSPQALTIPVWLVQLVPIALLIASAVMVFATQRADVDLLKASIQEFKNQQQTYVTRQIFDLKLAEQERAQNQLNARLDKIETLINGLYDRLPPKKEK